MSGSARTSLKELAVLFLRLGTTAFGGPAAHISPHISPHISVMRTEVVGIGAGPAGKSHVTKRTS